MVLVQEEGTYPFRFAFVYFLPSNPGCRMPDDADMPPLFSFLRLILSILSSYWSCRRLPLGFAPFCRIAPYFVSLSCWYSSSESAELSEPSGSPSLDLATFSADFFLKFPNVRLPTTGSDGEVYSSGVLWSCRSSVLGKICSTQGVSVSLPP